MLSVLFSDSTEEIAIVGDRGALQRFAVQLRIGGSGAISLTHAVDPSPYSRSLARIELREGSGKVFVSVDLSRSVLSMQGAKEHFDILAENIHDLSSESDAHNHLHVDYFPGHYYLAEGSRSVVVSISNAE